MKFTEESILQFADRLDIVRSGMEEGLDDWPIASHIYEYKLSSEIIRYLVKEIKKLNAI